MAHHSHGCVRWGVLRTLLGPVAKATVGPRGRSPAPTRVTTGMFVVVLLLSRALLRGDGHGSAAAPAVSVGGRWQRKSRPRFSCHSRGTHTPTKWDGCGSEMDIVHSPRSLCVDRPGRARAGTAMLYPCIWSLAMLCRRGRPPMVLRATAAAGGPPRTQGPRGKEGALAPACRAPWAPAPQANRLHRTPKEGCHPRQPTESRRAR